MVQPHPLAIAHYKFRKVVFSFFEIYEGMSNPLHFGKVGIDMEIELIKRSIRLDRERLADTSSNLLIQKNIGRTAVMGRERVIKERIKEKMKKIRK